MSLALHEISEANHRILDPITDDQLVTVGRLARVGDGTRVLDLACGKGELLVRWAQVFGATGVGVDVSTVFVPAARARATELGVEHLVRFELGDAAAYVPPDSYDVACCVGATWIGGGTAGTIELLRKAVPPGGLLVIGECYWRDPPPRCALDDMPDVQPLGGLLDVFDRAGTDLVEMMHADEASWDRYVAAQWFTLRRWLDEHPDDPLRQDVRAFLDTSRRTYLDVQRRYLGWGVFLLRPSRS